MANYLLEVFMANKNKQENEKTTEVKQSFFGKCYF